MADNKQKKPNFFAKTVKYFKDTKSEMKKVTWLSKHQVIKNTLVVLGVVLVASIVICGLDAIFGLLLQLILQTA